VAEARRAGFPAGLWVLGAGLGWGSLAGAAAGITMLGAEGPVRGLGDAGALVLLSLLYGATTGAAFGLGLALLPAVAVSFARSERQARVTATGACLSVAGLLAAASFRDGFRAQEPYAAVLVTAALFGVWRCPRSAALAVRRTRVQRPEASPPAGLPLAEPAP
jgi:hypothetical protein